jgi:6-hydroxycyclohex-1-ene-1-carbonyl-CoA dehydrogenase
MKAAFLRDNLRKLSVEETPVPEISEGYLLVKVVACGVCHTDLHYLDHGIPTLKKPPVILGHEAAGIVEEEGKIFKKGQRVLLPAIFTCGKCQFCFQERENVCQNMIMLGNSIDGAFAEYVKVPEKDVISLPDEIPLEEGCIIADAVSSPYHAVINRAKVKPFQKVLVMGCGGVGINIIQICVLQGAEVIACDLNPEKLKIAKELGAGLTINPSEICIKDFLKQNDGLVDVAFEVIGIPSTIETAYKTLRPTGKLIIVGYTNQNISLNPAKIMFFEQEIIGSVGCRPVDYPQIIELVKSGKINIKRLIANKYELLEVNKALDELRNSNVLRNIILPNGKGQDPLYT